MIRRDLKWFFEIPHKLVEFNIKPKLQPLLRLREKFPPLSSYQKEFIRKLSQYKIPWDDKNKNIVLTQVVKDYSFAIKLSSTAFALAKKYNSNIALYSVATRLEDETYKGEGVWNKGYYKKANRILNKVFLSFGGKIIHLNVDVFDDQSFILQMADEIMENISHKSDILKIKIENILVGDLIYDTYLRFADKPTVNIKDPFLKNTVIETLNIFFNFKKIAGKYNIVALVNSYSTYIHHGVVIRLCLDRKIPVYVPLCGFLSIIHKVSPSYAGHSNNYFNYPILFDKMQEKKDLLEKYTHLFEKRFSGEKDLATFYMKKSAFSKTENPELNSIDWKNTVIVLAHCFFDSPHIYRSMVFPDFYDWLIFTLDNLVLQKDLTVLVKEHPNGREGNVEIFAELKEKYKNTIVSFIDKNTSQNQIIQSKPIAVITSYGTAASEFSYCGIPVLALYDTPYTAYDFANIAFSTDEYRNYLINIRTLDCKQNKNQIIEYYYMHNFFFFKGRDADYLSLNKYQGQTYSDDFLKDYLPKMDEAYFKMLDQSIKDGFEMVELEEKFFLKMNLKSYIKNKIKQNVPKSIVMELNNEFLDHKFAQGYRFSFSQEGEDMVLDRFMEGRANGFFVDIGAHHPVRFSNTYHFYQSGWRGINIDATPGSMKEFNLLRPEDINLEVGVGPERGELEYFMFHEPALNTFSPQRAGRLQKETHFKLKESRKVEVKSLVEILEKFVPPNKKIDFMTVDVEGLDYEILASNNWKKFRPDFLLVEDLGNELENIKESKLYQLLVSTDYKLMAKTHNTLFFKNKLI